MTRPVIFMFSGQGSQYYQMGKELYADHPVFREWMQRLDGIAEKETGRSILEAVYGAGNRPGTPFDDTRFTHPAIFMVEVALFHAFAAEGIRPDFVLGASLGEYAAAAVSGAATLEEMLSLLLHQVEVFHAHCPGGGMCAIVHDQRLYEETALIRENSEMASRNFQGHFVVSGHGEPLREIEAYLEETGITHQHLPVSFGFHSPAIDPAAEALKTRGNRQRFRAPEIPFISCATAGRVERFAADHFWNVARKTVDFQATIETLESAQPHTYVDLGPSGTLANFVKQNLKNDSESEVFHVFSPFGQDLRRLEKVASHLAATTTAHRAPSVASPRQRKGKDRHMVTWMFPGQGSQRKGMGGELFDEYGELTATADDILGYSIKTLCLEDPEGRLGQTQYTQPALYVVNALTHRQKLDASGTPPDFVAGHSLGEYNALLAAGGVTFASGLKLVKKRGELMSRASGGAMAALQKVSPDDIREILAQNGLDGIDIANYNSPSQIVISGMKADIQRALGVFGAAKIAAIPLNVSGAFHSRYMRDAKAEFEAYLREFEFSELTIPLMANVHARPYEQADIAANLAAQITQSVQWTDTVRYLMGKGEMRFEEVGPGRVLANLVKKIQREATPLVIAEPEAVADIFPPEPQAPPEETAPPDVPDTDGEPPPKEETPSRFTAGSLGSAAFRAAYGVKYAYAAGAMASGISTREMVARLANAGMMGFLSTDGLPLPRVAEDLRLMGGELANGGAYGLNLTYRMNAPGQTDRLVDLCLENRVANVEVSGFLQIPEALVRYRLTGLSRDESGEDTGKIRVAHRVMARATRPEVAEMFLSPPPEDHVAALVAKNLVTDAQAALAKQVAMADDICVAADSGGDTELGVMTALLPTMVRLRDELSEKFSYPRKIRIGAAGGIGTPEAAAAAFLLGADFILTGYLNQCTIEAGTSSAVKKLLQTVNVQDTDYAPAADMFELGTKVQVLKKGVFFPARANKLYQLYRQYDAWEDLDPKTRRQIETRFLKLSFNEAYDAAVAHFSGQRDHAALTAASESTKEKMALVFRWYLEQAVKWALTGEEDRKVDYQVYCGPALGAFNQWVKGTRLADWEQRHVDDIAKKLMNETAIFLEDRIANL